MRRAPIPLAILLAVAATIAFAGLAGPAGRARAQSQPPPQPAVRSGTLHALSLFPVSSDPALPKTPGMNAGHTLPLGDSNLLILARAPCAGCEAFAEAYPPSADQLILFEIGPQPTSLTARPRYALYRLNEDDDLASQLIDLGLGGDEPCALFLLRNLMISYACAPTAEAAVAALGQRAPQDLAAIQSADRQSWTGALARPSASLEAVVAAYEDGDIPGTPADTPPVITLDPALLAQLRALPVAGRERRVVIAPDAAGHLVIRAVAEANAYDAPSCMAMLKSLEGCWVRVALNTHTHPLGSPDLSVADVLIASDSPRPLLMVDRDVLELALPTLESQRGGYPARRWFLIELKDIKTRCEASRAFGTQRIPDQYAPWEAAASTGVAVYRLQGEQLVRLPAYPFRDADLKQGFAVFDSLTAAEKTWVITVATLLDRVLAAREAGQPAPTVAFDPATDVQAQMPPALQRRFGVTGYSELNLWLLARMAREAGVLLPGAPARIYLRPVGAGPPYRSLMMLPEDGCRAMVMVQLSGADLAGGDIQSTAIADLDGLAPALSTAWRPTTPAALRAAYPAGRPLDPFNPPPTP